MATRTAQISVRLPASLLEGLDSLARERNEDRSELVREAIQLYLGGPGSTEPNSPYARVRDLVGSVTGGPPDLGRRHREYLRERLGDG